MGRLVDSDITPIGGPIGGTPFPPNGGFRPSNGTEGDIFRSYTCNRCVKDHAWHVPPYEADESCPIIMSSLAGEYAYPNEQGPPQWSRDPVYACSEFEGPCPCLD